ncbi:MAG: hypothetical protein LC754_08240 [Acidobacteria bacterium]|nr:hypothetical protein [Acidobacteriota bacterium]
MPKSPKKKGGSAQPLSASLSTMPSNPDRPGMPAQDSIIGVTIMASSLAATVGGKQYRIFETNEMDEYEKGASSPEKFALFSAASAATPTGDNYTGKDRKAAKISIAKAKIEKFDDLEDLINSLTADEEMTNHDPRIGTGQASGRVEEEQRNVRVNAFLYAASREKDNDFHLIIGRDPDKTPEMYMTMELSGLPPASSPARKKLKAARDAFKKFYQEYLGTRLPGLGYGFPDPPVPVVIEGSLFFDVTHSKGQRPGPKSLKSRIPTVWEVHPITKMVFKP